MLPALPLPRLRRTALKFCALASLPLLAACSGESDSIDFAPACPVVEIPGEAADYYQYSGTDHDITHLVARASLTRVVGSCEAGEHRTVMTNMKIGLHVERGPASKVDFVNIPYFVAVVFNGEIKSKKEFVAHVSFEDGRMQDLTHTSNIPITLPVSRHIHSDQYHLEIGFQLTKAQLDFNRAHLVMPTFHKM
ncbi:hypothetical protein CFR78_02735 [Komagataeibacter rhaeticus]|uniref:Uncharacterized protein n=1 Tax=Komagataeibacter rhaeticus TaxID=215221 RepID=A0A181CC97_9PROT|nr:hypothetical protein [Komagataeibacter rhaeticus]ATU72025.1 hypothetical protein CT154_03345 [Komagataeibacter xylinus]EGG75447.1 hypothetical protein SXCC_03882 [Gluconacetobacter sp. SXCC-1]KDU95675.1 hypothetical protein GLUCORHAEAF1_06150 [Komagataeibacter rhaeticus AF1]PYD54553.1 hypothetical protein CFR78_02735 [Komagataeibacter rhaeticus]QIP35852.1 hypothetical protein GWK63_10570 [Komagataeibacter rhaeticus]